MSPTERRINDSFDELGKAIEALPRHSPHRCRGCGCELLPEQPCGAMCSPCAEQAAVLHAEQSERDTRVVFALVVGWLLGLPSMVGILLLGGWLP